MPEHAKWRAAMATVKRYTADAMLEAAARADQRTNWHAAATWHRILDAIERLQARTAAIGEKVRRSTSTSIVHCPC
jgi:hypothetical protein